MGEFLWLLPGIFSAGLRGRCPMDGDQDLQQSAVPAAGNSVIVYTAVRRWTLSAFSTYTVHDISRPFPCHTPLLENPS